MNQSEIQVLIYPLTFATRCKKPHVSVGLSLNCFALIKGFCYLYLLNNIRTSTKQLNISQFFKKNLNLFQNLSIHGAPLQDLILRDPKQDKEKGFRWSPADE